MKQFCELVFFCFIQLTSEFFGVLVQINWLLDQVINQERLGWVDGQEKSMILLLDKWTNSSQSKYYFGSNRIS